MMPTQTTETATPKEIQYFDDTKPAKVLNVTQESIPYGRANEKAGLHLFTVSAVVTDPPKGAVAKQDVKCQVTAPDNWDWVQWANYYWYNDKAQKVVGDISSVSPKISGRSMTFILQDVSLNTGDKDSNRLCITLLAVVADGAKAGTTTNGAAVIGVDKKEAPFPAKCGLQGIIA
ncbi:hypothetical protein [Kitasatospora brasiliensis]|uniref:hypothetical protein n=1 Tax=Kitasatospora brasiliensis TaxID=3058040 RepID=UPI00292E27A4|nr:hypothetical protein [Kitasatospora sp. K002]